MRTDRRLTEHAQMRKQQRGIKDLQLQLLQHFGTDHYQKGGCSLCFIDRKTIQMLRSAIDNLDKLAAVKTPSETLATVMHMDRRIHSTQYAA